ncbi:hypothetical protein [Martelella sp. AD-3]|uniref:portal protein n=1 Tax=Martelella sp. AD-3 TaxID=686597 RepID=UPI0006850674|nr:hypothetical protein [Martelella sp. AD-3]AMM84121.1 hypothetical protein AZF01_06925 [Martelella sp. AD-3]
MFEPETQSGMDLREGRMVRASDPWDRNETAQPEGKALHRLDSERAVARLKRLLGLYENELERQAENRAQQALDEDFYDSIQWSEENARELEERGQKALVFNVINTTVNWIIGTEKRGRTDYKILPRRKEAGKPATRKTQLMKYLSDVNRSPFHRSNAFEESVKTGIGWLEVGLQAQDEGEPVYVRAESWRNMLWDSACTEKDLSDCRYIFRTKWVDLDVASAMFPERRGLLARAALADGVRVYGSDTDGDEAMDSQEAILESAFTRLSSSTSLYDVQRPRVRLIECWHRYPRDVHRMAGGDFTGEIYDPQNPAPGHEADIAEGRGEPVERPRSMRMHVSIFCPSGMLYDGESPYRHNDFPFTPIWCYRRGRDKLPYGVIRGLRDIQEDINKRASKALHIISTNKVIMDEGAVDDLDEFREEAARPDAILVKKKGYDLTINAERELAAAHLDMMSRDISMIQSVSGVTDESLGRTTNAVSGRAITARQDQGSLATAGIFDNLRLAVLIHGGKELSAIEQFFTQPKQFRITNTRGTPEWVDVNDGLPENDIIRSKADFIISDTDWRASVRQTQTEELFALLQQIGPVAPQVVLVMLDLLVEGMDIDSREELVKRIRQITGQRDPDAEEMTPEEQAAEQLKMRQQQIQERAVMAKIAKDEASAQKSAASAQRDIVSSAKDQAATRQVLASLAGQNVDTQIRALEAAMAALSAPAAVPVADGILHESGFMGRSEQEETERQAAIMQSDNMRDEAARQQALAAQQGQSPPQQDQQGIPQQGRPPSMPPGTAPNP